MRIKINPKIWSITILAIVVIFFIGRDLIKKNRLDSNHRYTIAHVYKFEIKARTSHSIYYMFSVNDKQYKGVSGVYENSENYVGRRFFVKYNPETPNNCLLLKDIPVPDSLKSALPNGWKELPIKK